MATRQELYTAIGIIRQTCRLNGHFPGVVSALEYNGGYDDPEKTDARFKDFADHKAYLTNLCDIIKTHSSHIDTVLTKATNTYLDSGFNGLPGVTINRLNATSDAQNINDISSTALPSIENSLAKETLSTLSSPFETCKPKCGTAEPDPWGIIELEDNYANILHDVIDAMSYELEGLNSYTGEPHGYGLDQFNKLINNRILTANVYLSKLPDNTDRNQMESIVRYIENNFNKLPHIELGKFIDANLEKQIMVRRWWAL